MSAVVQTIPMNPSGIPRREQGFVQPFKDIEGFEDVKLPFTLIEGNKPGPCLLVTAGVHGSEVNAIETARRLMDISTEQINGTLLVLPMLSLNGFKKHSIFVMPEDGKNLNRVFPGKVDGTLSERLAHWLISKIFPHASAYIDHHSADATEELTPFTVFVDGDDKARELAIVFGLPIAVGMGENGNTINGASDVGLPGIIAEVGEGGRWSEPEVHKACGGVARVMKHLGMLVHSSIDGKSNGVDTWPHNPEGKIAAPVENAGTPRTTTGQTIPASCEGIWRPSRKRKPGDSVEEGEVLGHIESIFGDTLETILAPFSGFYLYGSFALWVAKDDVVFGVVRETPARLKSEEVP